MSNLTQITDKIFALPAPASTYGFYIELSMCQEFYYLSWVYGSKGQDAESDYIKLDGNYDEVGTVDLESISFDCSGYTNATGLMAEYWFRNLLKSKGIEPTSESKILIIEKV